MKIPSVFHQLSMSQSDIARGAENLIFITYFEEI
jgi:hypothetical protein